MHNKMRTEKLTLLNITNCVKHKKRIKIYMCKRVIQIDKCRKKNILMCTTKTYYRYLTQSSRSWHNESLPKCKRIYRINSTYKLCSYDTNISQINTK